MKVIILIPGMPLKIGDIKGGVFSALSNLLKGLSEKNISVRVISFNREVTQPHIVEYSPNIEIHYTPESKLPHVVNFLFAGSAVLKKHIKEFEPSLVHFSMSGYILLTKVFGLLGKKQLVTIHGIVFPEARLKKKLKDKLVWYSNGIVEIMLCPKNLIHLSKYSLALQGGKKEQTYTIIPNAVDPTFFDIPVKSNSANKLIYVGSIEYNKNLLLLLKALQLLIAKERFFFLDVVGGFMDEEYRNEVTRFIKENQLENYVKLYGWASQQQVQEVMIQSDILVVCSMQESLPMAIAEAMSAGKLVIASDVGGIPEMITHGEDGFIFNVAKPENLVSILDELYGDTVRIEQMQKAAKEKATYTYHSSIVATKTIAFYEQIIANEK